LEPDAANPAVRYFALRQLLDCPEDDPQVRQARSAIMTSGPVPLILAAQQVDGSWLEPDRGKWPGYKSTAWQLIFLAELGVDPADAQVRRGCDYLLSHALAANGAFSMIQPPIASKVVHCHNANQLRALICLGYGADPRLQAAIDWQVRAITGVGGIRYYKSGTSGPGFACAANGGQACAWGAVKALRMLVALPATLRTPLVQTAIDQTVALLFSHDLAQADYPHSGPVSGDWFKFGFPLTYTADILEALLALNEAGYGADPRLHNAIAFVATKQDADGRWRLERTLNGKMWVDIETKGEPSKWLTLRALTVLRGDRS
jgi:hypothetical protein